MSHPDDIRFSIAREIIISGSAKYLDEQGQTDLVDAAITQADRFVNAIIAKGWMGSRDETTGSA